MELDVLKSLRCSLTLHFAVIAWLTATLVATGSGSYFLPVLIFCVSITAYIFVDRLEWFELGRVGSYVGMLAATAFSVGSYLYSAFSIESESGQLAAIAGLLVYPEAVLFLQRKSLRVYEQLAVFLLLEMIVAALVNDNILFGVLLAPIMLMWVSSLFLFSRYATLVQMDPTLDEPIPILVEILYRMFVKTVIGEKLKPSIVTTNTSLASIQASRGLRRTLQSIPLGVGAIVFAGFFFYLLPRTGPAQYEPSLGAQARIGLPTTLSIGTVGRLLSDPTPVMRVTLKALATGQNYAVKESPYIRARVLDAYGEFSSNDWVQHGEWVFSGVHEYRRLRGPESSGVGLDRNRDLVEVEFDIKQQFASTLFTLPPAFATAKPLAFPLEFDRFNMVLDDLNPSRLPRGKSLVYSLGSAAFAKGVQLRLTPALLGSGRLSETRNLFRLTSNFHSFKYCDQYRQKLLRDSKLDARRTYEVAKHFEHHFTNSDFTYTLDLRPPIDPEMDPIEDFLINQRRGHCQYFASAMVMMLRQSNIPSRIVVGYKPREFNKLGKYYSVKQNDAHAWVEALITRSELDGTELEHWATDSESYWVRFDPTPESADDGSISQQGQAIDYAEKLWKDYVVEGQKLTSEDSLYAPVAANSENAYAAAVEKFKQLRQRVIAGELFTGLGRIGFAWQAAILITAIGVLAILLWQGSKLLQRFAPRLASRIGLKRPPKAIKQAFFARCVALLARRGLRRELHETPEEFTHRASQTLTDSSAATAPATAPAAGALGLLTAHYYRLRFGHNQTLSTAEQQDIDHALKQVLNAIQK
ncbi:MAG: DUF3488 domain-containing protein [Pirellulaceae bacterium]|nr:DUF3488 domain-containing protein [Pirellulaceae bacterium]